MNKLNKNKIDSKYLTTIEKLIRENNNVFYVEGDAFIPTDVYKHKIILKPNSQIVHVKQFRIPQCDRIEINRQVKELLDNGIIEPSRSPYNSPVFLVNKAPSAFSRWNEIKTNYTRFSRIKCNFKRTVFQHSSY